MDDLQRHTLSADREIVDRALGLRAPIAMAGDIYRPEGIALASNCSFVGLWHRSSLSNEF
jgi:propanediol utilization protein